MPSNLQIPTYLLEQLDRIAVENNYKNHEIVQTIGSNHGDGLMATIIGITINDGATTNIINKNPPLKLICKMLPQNVAQRKTFSPVVLFEREVIIYQEILPEFMEFQLEKGLTTNSNGFFQYPKCYYAISDIKTDQHVIIMENLRSQNYDLWNKFKSIDFDRVKLLMQSLGRCHGLSLAIRDQKPNTFKKLTKLNDLLIDMLNVQGTQQLFRKSYNELLEMFIGEKEQLIIENIKELFIEKFHNCLRDNVAEPYSVLGHGDCWNNNMMFLDNKEIKLLDWQLARFGSPVLDLSVFILTSTTHELREKYLNEFIDIYYENLSEILTKCNCSSEKLLPRNVLNEHFQKFGQYGVLMAPIVLKIMVSDPKDICPMDELAEDLISKSELETNNNVKNNNTNNNINNNNDVAAEDEKEDDSVDMVTFNEKSALVFRERVKYVIQDALQYQWITKS